VKERARNNPGRYILAVLGSGSVVQRNGHCVVLVMTFNEQTTKFEGWIKDSLATEAPPRLTRAQTIASGLGMKMIRVFGARGSEMSASCVLEALRYVAELMETGHDWRTMVETWSFWMMNVGSGRPIKSKTGDFGINPRFEMI
jgi:hypothetical protein